MIHLVGGAEISLAYLMEGLSDNRYHPYLLTSAPGPLLDHALSIGIQGFFHEFPWLSRRKPWHYAGAIYYLVEIIRKYQIELIHTNCAHSLSYVMWASRITGVPYISHVRDFIRPWFNSLNLPALKRAKYIIATSQAIAQACDLAGISDKKLKIIYNPIDVEKFKHADKESCLRWRSAYGIPTTALLIGVVGQIHPVKGQYEFIQSCLNLLPQIPDAHFVVIGDAIGDEQNCYLETIKELLNGNSEIGRFHFTGFQNDIATAMTSVDILVIPSNNEAFGRVAVEGMAAGCPIVATRVGGLVEIVEHEKNGLLVQPKDVPALSDSIYRMVTDSSIRDYLVSNGHLTAQQFNVQQHVKSVQDLYDSVLTRKSRYYM